MIRMTGRITGMTGTKEMTEMKRTTGTTKTGMTRITGNPNDQEQNNYCNRNNQEPGSLLFSLVLFLFSVVAKRACLYQQTGREGKELKCKYVMHFMPVQ
jgi:hypothetical protein